MAILQYLPKVFKCAYPSRNIHLMNYAKEILDKWTQMNNQGWLSTAVFNCQKTVEVENLTGQRHRIG